MVSIRSGNSRGDLSPCQGAGRDIGVCPSVLCFVDLEKNYKHVPGGRIKMTILTNQCQKLDFLFYLKFMPQVDIK